MLSKTKINNRLKKKTNSQLAEALFLAKKTGNIEIASGLAVPARKQIKVNLGRLNEIKSDEVIIPGKVLSSGNINKKLKVIAMSFSEEAIEKLRRAGCEINYLPEILKKLKGKEKLKGEIIK